MGVSIHGGSQNGWFVMENPLNMDENRGYPHFRTPPDVLIIHHPSSSQHSLSRHHAPWQIHRGDAQETLRWDRNGSKGTIFFAPGNGGNWIARFFVEVQLPPRVWLQGG